MSSFKSNDTPQSGQTMPENVPSSGSVASKPNPSSQPAPSETPSQDAPPSEGGEQYPEQKHAGAVGLGPEYGKGPGFSEKIKGYKEEFQGKLTHKADLVERGHDRVTGELKRKEQKKQDEKLSSKINPAVGKKDSSPQDGKRETESQAEQEGTIHNAGDRPYEKSAKEQAATLSTEGTESAEQEKKGRAVDNVKTFG